MARSSRVLLVAASAVLVSLVSAGTGRAELVFLSSGRTLSVKSHRFEGESIVLTLRSGGQITCEAALVERIEPDEVPYPEPEVAALGARRVLAAAELAVHRVRLEAREAPLKRL